jgi:hypothetical protein
VDLLTTLGRTVGFSFAAGINLYATVAIMGLAHRYHWVALPPQFQVFDNSWLIGAALALYVVEFVADKIPWVDSLWDALHTVIRPAGAALIAVASAGHTGPTTQALIALAGAAIGSTSHFAKAGTRVAANASPEPFSNWFLSLSEDGFVIALGVLALRYPLAAAVVVIVCLVTIAAAAGWLVRRLRSHWRQRRLE